MADFLGLPPAGSERRPPAMDAYQARFSSSLRDILENRVTELTEQLVTTQAQDYATYTERVGKIKGIKIALIELHDLETRMGRPEVHEEAAPMYGRRYEE